MKVFHTPTATEQRICVGTKVQLYLIATVGEALALPFFKVRLTKRKCLARLIQRKLLMVGRQKVLHTILPGAHVL